MAETGKCRPMPFKAGANANEVMSHAFAAYFKSHRASHVAYRFLADVAIALHDVSSGTVRDLTIVRGLLGVTCEPATARVPYLFPGGPRRHQK